MAELDIDALRLPRGARHSRECAFTRWSLSSDLGKAPACDCDWPDLLAALERHQRALGLIAELREQLQDAEIVGDEMLPAERSLLDLAEEVARG